MPHLNRRQALFGMTGALAGLNERPPRNAAPT